MLYRLARGILRLYFSLCRGWVVEGLRIFPKKGNSLLLPIIAVIRIPSFWEQR